MTLLVMGIPPPPQWTQASTVLIPKDGDLNDLNNWRPLTISSGWTRIFHRILASRLKRTVNLHHNQRGFTDSDGVLINTSLLETYIKDKSSANKPYNIMALDVRKAFDTVHHVSILQALQDHKVDPRFIQYIKDDLRAASTSIKIGRNHSNAISINRGVKQGDPLSPLLFNIALDGVIQKLEQSGLGGTFGSGEDKIQITSMAFADDLVVLADNEAHLQPLYDIIENSLNALGMSLNIKKCKCLSVALVQKRPTPRTTPIVQGKEGPIHMVTALNTVKYLGNNINCMGTLKPNITNLNTWLKNVHRAALKPDQKLLLIKQHVIPRVLFTLQNPKLDAKTLKAADKIIKLWVKRSLHMSSRTPDAALYGRLKDGGIGVTCLHSAIPYIYLRRLAKISTIPDPQLACLMKHPFIIQLKQRLERIAPDSPPEVLWRQRIIDCPITKGLQEAAANNASRSWIDNKPMGWSGKDYVRAIHLRTGNLPTAGMMSNPIESRKCRAGCAKSETICHVLQNCPSTHWERIRRHNEIMKKIANQAKTITSKVDLEPHVRHPDGTLFKPDIIAHTNNKAYIIDVQVCWEGDISLDESNLRKQNVYNNGKFKEALEKLYPGPSFHAITIGARGNWPRSNDDIAEVLKISPKFKASCIHSALKWASSIHTAFGRNVWRRR